MHFSYYQYDDNNSQNDNLNIHHFLQKFDLNNIILLLYSTNHRLEVQFQKIFLYTILNINYSQLNFVCVCIYNHWVDITAGSRDYIPTQWSDLFDPELYQILFIILIKIYSITNFNIPKTLMLHSLNCTWQNPSVVDLISYFGSFGVENFLCTIYWNSDFSIYILDYKAADESQSVQHIDICNVNNWYFLYLCGQVLLFLPTWLCVSNIVQCNMT